MTNGNIPLNKIKFLLRLAVLPALFFISHPAWTQSGHYVIEQRYVQQIAWIGDEYTLKYEVVIEKNDGKGYLVFMREFTDLPTLQISVPPGNYRYRIIPYDFLEQPGDASAWINIDIKPAPDLPADGEIIEEGSVIPQSNGNKQISLYLSAAWAPLFPIYGRIQEIFGYDFYATGAAIRFGLLFNKQKLFNPGLELSTSWYAFNKEQDGDTIAINAGVTSINFVIRQWLPNRKLAFTFKAGGGISFQTGEINIGGYLYSMGGLIPQLNADVSFLWLALKQFYLEIGINYNHFLNENNSSGCLRPWLGIGLLF